MSLTKYQHHNNTTHTYDIIHVYNINMMCDSFIFLQVFNKQFFAVNHVNLLVMLYIHSSHQCHVRVC